MRTHRRGFTLVELLVVITIIGLLVAITVPAVQSALERGRQTLCQNHMTECGKAAITFATTKDHFPGYRNPAMSTNGQPVSWQIALLGNIERIDLQQQWYQGVNPLPSPYIDVYICPSDNTAVGLTGPMTSFVVNTGRQGNNATPQNDKYDGVFHDLSATNGKTRWMSLTDFPDGADTTVLFSENLDTDKYWPLAPADPEDTLGISWGGSQLRINELPGSKQRRSNFGTADFQYSRPSSNHPGTVNVVFAGGNYKAIDENINPDVWKQLMTPNGRKVGVTTILQEGSY